MYYPVKETGPNKAPVLTSGSQRLVRERIYVSEPPIHPLHHKINPILLQVQLSCPILLCISFSLQYSSGESHELLFGGSRQFV